MHPAKWRTDGVRRLSASPLVTAGREDSLPNPLDEKTMRQDPDNCGCCGRRREPWRQEAADRRRRRNGGRPCPRIASPVG